VKAFEFAGAVESGRSERNVAPRRHRAAVTMTAAATRIVRCCRTDREYDRDLARMIVGGCHYRCDMAEFIREDLRDSRFERVDLRGSEFRSVDLTDARFRGVDIGHVVMRGVALFDVDIHGEIEHVTINGVDIGPLVNGELDRRYPDRAKMRPEDPAGFREAWDVIERLWESGTTWTCRGTRCLTRRVFAATARCDPRSTVSWSCAGTGWPPCARSSMA